MQEIKFTKTQPAWLNVAVLIMSIIFLIMANVSHTIALRYTILAIFLLIAIHERASVVGIFQRQRGPLLAMLAFIFYALFHTGVLSLWYERSVGELYNQLLMASLWFFVGLVLFQRWRGLSVLDVVILAGFSLAAAEFIYSGYLYYITGSWPYNDVSTTDTKLEFTFFMNFVLGFVVTAFCFGKSGKLSALPRWFLVLVFALILFDSLRAGARNGMIGLVYLMLSMLVIYSIFEGKKHGWRRMAWLAFFVVISVGSVASYALLKDPRNSRFIGSVAAGWHYKDTNGWLRTGPRPVLANGDVVDGSAYERVAWIHSGLDLIKDRPQGYGFARNAFGLALQHRGYKPFEVAHSHSGFIDFGISLGLPGVMLWVLMCAVFIRYGFEAFRTRRDVLGLALVLVTAGFMGRMLVESINKDHMLHIFLFTAGAALAELEMRKRQNPCSATDKQYLEVNNA